MNTPLRVGAAAVIGLLLLGAGIYLFGGGGSNVGGSAAPTPSPSPTPSPMPLPSSGQLEPGTYAISDASRPTGTLVPFTFTVPAGWAARDDLQISKGYDTPGEVAFTPWIVSHVYTDACKSEGNLVEIGPSVDDLVTALENQAASDVTIPVDLEVGGHPAKLVTVSVPTAEHLDSSACRNPGLIQIWADPAESAFFAIPVDPAFDLPVNVYIVDVGGERVVFVSTYTSAASAADVAELEAVIESIRFQP